MYRLLVRMYLLLVRMYKLLVKFIEFTPAPDHTAPGVEKATNKTKQIKWLHLEGDQVLTLIESILQR